MDGNWTSHACRVGVEQMHVVYIRRVSCMEHTGPQSTRCCVPASSSSSFFSLSLSLMLRPFIIRVYKVDPSFKKFSNWMTRVLLEWTDHRQREVCIQESFPTTLIYSSVYPMYSHVISRVGDGARFILHLRTHRFFLSFLLLRICFC
jgi:hypothetical protein